MKIAAVLGIRPYFVHRKHKQITSFELANFTSSIQQSLISVFRDFGLKYIFVPQFSDKNDFLFIVSIRVNSDEPDSFNALKDKLLKIRGSYSWTFLPYILSLFDGSKLFPELPVFIDIVGEDISTFNFHRTYSKGVLLREVTLERTLQNLVRNCVLRDKDIYLPVYWFKFGDYFQRPIFHDNVVYQEDYEKTFGVIPNSLFEYLKYKSVNLTAQELFLSHVYSQLLLSRIYLIYLIDPFKTLRQYYHAPHLQLDYIYKPILGPFDPM